MVRFECDYCHRLKEFDEIWILGFAAETVGVTAARREINIVSSWNDVRAVEALAVHFCSDECQREYMGELFGEEPPETEVIEEEVAVVPRRTRTEKRIVRTIPAVQVETTVKTGKGVSTRVRKARRKAS